MWQGSALLGIALPLLFRFSKASLRDSALCRRSRCEALHGPRDLRCVRRTFNQALLIASPELELAAFRFALTRSLADSSVAAAGREE